MKVSKVEVFTVGSEWRNLTIVQVHTDEGLTGLGESRIPNHASTLEA